MAGYHAEILACVYRYDTLKLMFDSAHDRRVEDSIHHSCRHQRIRRGILCHVRDGRASVVGQPARTHSQYHAV